MVDREALEQFERDPNPYAVDPRLTEGTDTAVPRSDEVLEYRRRVTWGMIDLPLLAGQLLCVNVPGAILFLILFLGRDIPWSGVMLVVLVLTLSVGSVGYVLSACFIHADCRVRFSAEAIDFRCGWYPWRLSVERTLIVPVRPFTWASLRSMLAVGSPTKYRIFLWQRWTRQLSIPCENAEDLDRMMREIETFLSSRW